MQGREPLYEQPSSGIPNNYSLATFHHDGVGLRIQEIGKKGCNREDF